MVFHLFQNQEQQEEETRQKQQLELEKLRARLRTVRQRRARIDHQRKTCREQHKELSARVDALYLKRQSEIEAHQSLVVQRESLSHFLSVSSRWNVINDCFHIWHAGPWGTINGLRLGGEAPRLPQGLLQPYAADDIHSGHLSNNPHSAAGIINGASNNTNGHPPPMQNPSQPPSTHHLPASMQSGPAPRRYLMWSAATLTNNPPSNLSPSNNHNSTTNPSVPLEPPRVPWQEINAALGYAVLLLQILKNRGHWDFSHDLIPMASASQMRVRKKDASPVVVNLFFDEDSFSTFSLFKGGALRNFNLALVAFVECLHQASNQLTDKTIAMPHAIRIGHSSPEEKSSEAQTAPTSQLPLQVQDVTVGGLSVAYQEATAVDFTRACKYLLTNLKWLVAYAVKHHVER